MEKYTQDFLPGFLAAEAEEREKMIDDATTQLYLARQFCRYDKQIKLCRSESTKRMLERCKAETIKLMERQ